MHLLCLATGKRWAILILCLLLLAFLPIVHKTTATDDNVDIREPYQLYFLKNGWFAYPQGSETFIMAWNKTKQLDEMSRFSTLGNYSVLIFWHKYTDNERDVLGGNAEVFVIVSTLQPDNNGLIHQLVVRFDLTYWRLESGEVLWDLPFRASCQQAYGFNLTSEKDAYGIFERFSEGFLVPYEGDVDCPPFLVFRRFLDFPDGLNSPRHSYLESVNWKNNNCS
jgi:hypothetical protein